MAPFQVRLVILDYFIVEDQCCFMDEQEVWDEDDDKSNGMSDRSSVYAVYEPRHRHMCC